MVRADTVGAGGTDASSPSPVHSPEPGYASQKVTGKDITSPRRHTTTRQPRMTSTIYSSYTKGPSHRLGTVPGTSRDELGRRPFPTPEPCPVTHSRAESPSTEHRAQVPLLGRCA